MKIAMLQCDSVAGDVAGNAARILEAVRAATGADLCVTPELALSGPRPGEYLHAEGFAPGLRRALDQLAEAVACLPQGGPALLLGAPAPSLSRPGELANAAILIHRGAVQVVSRRMLSPEARQGREFAVDGAPWGDGISLGIVTLEGWRLGVIVCEDAAVRADAFWNPGPQRGHDPLRDLMRRGVDAILHMTAAPFRPGAQEQAERVLSHVAARERVHLLSANLVGGDGSIVYSGQSLAYDPSGRLLARGRAFAPDVVMVDTAAETAHGMRPEAPALSDENTAEHRAAGGAATLVVNRIQPPCVGHESLWNALVLGTRDFVRKSGATGVLLGLSGGMDSALVACVAAEALGADNVTGVIMPSPHTSAASVEDALAVAANLGLPTLTLPIAPLMAAFETALAPGFDRFAARSGDVTLENLQARIRGVLLVSLANRSGGLVLNTGNKSEIAVGYCTLYGDAVGALAVIGDITKSEVYALGRWLNAFRGRDLIPARVLTKEPSAELRPGQKDTDSLPPYASLDPVLERLLRRAGQEPGRADATEGGQGRDGTDGGDGAACDALCRETRALLFGAEFKRRQLPPALRVSGAPFGQGGWQAPLVGRWRMP